MDDEPGVAEWELYWDSLSPEERAKELEMRDLYVEESGGV